MPPAADLTASNMVSWMIRLKIHPGREADFLAQSAKLIESTRHETGALNYEWSLGADGVCHIYERYVDSAAVKIHGQRNAELVKELWEMATYESFVVYGSPDEEVRQRLAGRKAVFMRPLGGFSR
jgi:quinol monooxygenase YgiN